MRASARNSLLLFMWISACGSTVEGAPYLEGADAPVAKDSGTFCHPINRLKGFC